MGDLATIPEAAIVLLDQAVRIIESDAAVNDDEATRLEKVVDVDDINSPAWERRCIAAIKLRLVYLIKDGIFVTNRGMKEVHEEAELRRGAER